MALRIGIIGAGRAGRARMRAVDAHPDAELAGIVSTQEDVATHSWDQLIEDPKVDAVCVCSINCAHAPQVRQALEAGKHVLCEYPLALTHDEGAELVGLAADRRQVLHVEHIELLSGTQLALRQEYEAMGRPRPAGGTYQSQANSEGWIASFEQAGFPSFSGISRLHRLVDLFGPATVADASFSDAGGEHHLIVDLEFVGGGTCRLDYRRGRGLPRYEKWAVRLDEGHELTTVHPLPTDPLFEQDLDAFVRRVAEGADSYVSDERILDVLSLAEAIRARCAAGAEIG
jgi:biliverdin reductase